MATATLSPQAAQRLALLRERVDRLLEEAIDVKDALAGFTDSAVPDLMPAKHAAPLLGIHYQTLYQHIRQGTFPATRIGSRWMVSRLIIEEYLSGTRPTPWQSLSGGAS